MDIQGGVRKKEGGGSGGVGCLLRVWKWCKVMQYYYLYLLAESTFIEYGSLSVVYHPP